MAEVNAQKKRYPSALPAYLPTMLIIASALAMGLAGRGYVASGAFALAIVSFFTTQRLLRGLEKAREQKSLLDQQLIQSQKLASIGELSAGIAHEINNPLAIIAQEAEWIKHLLQTLASEDTKEKADFQDSLREISQQVDRCKEITQNLLNFARKVEPVLQEVNVNKLVEDMARLVEREARQKEISIVREFQEDLPTILSDPPCLRQVFLNLLNNARQAIEGSGTIRVGTRLGGDGALEVVVRDTGCGIPKEQLNKIFDPFFTTKPQGKGTGLGLSICHGIIDRLGGRISVTSEVGEGATFTVHLPVNPRQRTR